MFLPKKQKEFFQILKPNILRIWLFCLSLKWFLLFPITPVKDLKYFVHFPPLTFQSFFHGCKEKNSFLRFYSKPMKKKSILKKSLGLRGFARQLFFLLRPVFSPPQRTVLKEPLKKTTLKMVSNGTSAKPCVFEKKTFFPVSCIN